MTSLLLPPSAAQWQWNEVGFLLLDRSLSCSCPPRNWTRMAGRRDTDEAPPAAAAAVLVVD